jgi:Cu2+-exporting ATPase
VTAPASASATARIAALVDAALTTRTRVERIADRVAAVLTPLVIAIALAAGAWWGVTGGAERGVLVGLAVLAVACPCGLGLATPLAMWTGVAAAARRGVIVRGATVLERLADVRTVLFDKTGTLTTGDPRLVRVEPPERTTEIVALAAGLEAGLAHPFARAIARAAVRRGIGPVSVADVQVVPGRGVRGRVDDEPVAIGAPDWITPGARPAHDGMHTAVALARAGRPIATLWLQESLRDGVGDAIASLRALGLEVELASGDARAPAVTPLFRPGEIALGLGPTDKVGRIRAAGARGAVAMVGDGFNDAPALAAADVGIAVNEAADLTRMTADIVVRRDGVVALPWTVAHARRVVRTARRSVGWAFAYNAVAVALAAAGRLEPVVATLAMLASSAAVVAIARRLAGAVDAAPPAEPAARALPHAA